uniref:Enoyl-CoA hydratase domain-containing protein 2, mitochondrial n=1 Tax=Cacopsylla melanoneura TaxID=428564 RepID=A0A8D9DVR8_9HEMI
MVKKTMFSFKSNIIARQIVLITGKPFYSTSSSVPSEVRSFTKLIRHNTQERAGIVELCLNRPEAKNAFSIAFVKELMDKIEEIRSVENIRCLLVRSLAKNVFCAGISLAKELIFTARLLDGEEAKSIRLLNHLVPQNFELNAAYEKSLSLAELIVCNGPIGVRAAKVAIDKGSQVDLATGMTLEGLCYDRVIPTQDRIEGLKAFAGKYKPIYKGV